MSLKDEMHAIAVAKAANRTKGCEADGKRLFEKALVEIREAANKGETATLVKMDVNNPDTAYQRGVGEVAAQLLREEGFSASAWTTEFKNESQVTAAW